MHLSLQMNELFILFKAWNRKKIVLGTCSRDRTNICYIHVIRGYYTRHAGMVLPWDPMGSYIQPTFFFVARSSRIMIPATLFVKSPVESWVLREVLPRDPGHPSFSELQQHVLWRVNAWQIDKLSLTGLIKCSRCKKKWKKVFDREWTTSQNELSVTTRCQSKVVHAHRSKNFKPSMFGYVECGARAQTSFYQTCTKVCTENFDFMDIGASWIRGV